MVFLKEVILVYQNWVDSEQKEERYVNYEPVNINQLNTFERFDRLLFRSIPELEC